VRINQRRAGETVTEQTIQLDFTQINSTCSVVHETVGPSDSFVIHQRQICLVFFGWNIGDLPLEIISVNKKPDENYFSKNSVRQLLVTRCT